MTDSTPQIMLFALDPDEDLAMPSRQCLDRRIPNKALIDEVAAWENSRNKHHTKADRQFTSADARVQLKTLYPAM